MPTPNDMTNGEIPAQPATGQEPDANEQLAIAPTTGDIEGQPAADPAAPADEPMIPKSRLDEESAKAAAAAEETERLKQQVLLMQTAQQYAPQPPAPAQQQASADPFDGMEADDYTTVGQQQAYAAQIQSQVEQQIQVGLFQARHLDYNEVVGSMNPATGQFQYSSHLTQALTKNPAMNQLLQQQTNPVAAMQLAYQLANAEKPAPTAPAPTNAAHLAQHAQNTASAQTAPMPGSAVGGAGEVNSEASVQGMSDAEFAQLDSQVMSGQFG